MRRSTRTHSIGSAVALILAGLGVLSQGCEGFNECDTHYPNYPVGKGPHSNYLFECRLSASENWVDGSGTVVHWSQAGSLFNPACGPLDLAPGAEFLGGYGACQELCQAWVNHYGAVNVDCSTAFYPQDVFVEAGMCRYYVGCEPGPFFMPPDGGGAPATPTVFCHADMNEPMNQNLDWNGDGTPDFSPCPGCLLYIYSSEVQPYQSTAVLTTSSCGYEVPLSAGQDPGAACVSYCYDMLQLYGGDNFGQHNCETFIVTEADGCAGVQGGGPSGPGGPVGTDLVWESATGGVEHERLACGACCEDLGVCEQLRGDPAPVPTEHFEAQVPATLSVLGTQVPTRAHVTIDVLRPADGPNVGPAYFELVTIAASFESTPLPSGTRTSRGEDELIFGARARLIRPALGAVRASSGEFQVPEGANFLLTLDVGVTARTAAPREVVYASNSPISGFIVDSASGARLDLRAREVPLAPGVSLTFGR